MKVADHVPSLGHLEKSLKPWTKCAPATTRRDQNANGPVHDYGCVRARESGDANVNGYCGHLNEVTECLCAVG